MIHKEAFDVFYKENTFNTWLWDQPYKTSYKITRSSQVVNTIQSIETHANLRTFSEDSDFENSYYEFSNSDLRELVNAMHHLGNSSMTRRGLVVKLEIDTPRLLKKFVRALGKFTNFRVVELHLLEGSDLASNSLSEWCEYLKTALEPVFGYAEEWENDRDRWRLGARGLRFHPVDHQNRMMAIGNTSTEVV